MSPEDYAREEREAEERLCNLRHAGIDERICTLKRSCDLRWAQEEKAMLARWAGLNERFAANDDRIRDAKVVADRAVEKAELLATDRAKQQNEWRDTVNDVIGTRLSRSEYLVQHGALVEKLDALERRHDSDLTAVRQVLSRSEGKGLGTNSAFVWLFIALAGAISVITLIIDLLFQH
jgi:hypothetical protein